MLIADVYIDLPSEEIKRAKSGWDAFKSLVGKQEDLGTGVEILTVDEHVVFAKLVEAFRIAGLTNVISLMVDNQVVFVDEDASDDDLALMIKQANESGVFNRNMEELRMVLETRIKGMHVILDLEMLTSVLLGREEIHLQLAARIDDLRPRVGSTAADYNTRIREFCSDWGNMSPYVDALRRFREALTISLKRSLPYCPTRVEDVRVQIVALQDEQIGRFRELVFGDELMQPVYRPAPLVERRGFFADRFMYFYYDAYVNFLYWVILDEMIASGAWNVPELQIVEPGGVPVASGADLIRKKNSLGWRSEVIAFADDGALRVSENIRMPSLSGDPLSDFSRWTPISTSEFD